MFGRKKQEVITALTTIPPPAPGACLPFIVSDEHCLKLTYYTQRTDAVWTGGTSVETLKQEDVQKEVAIISFIGLKSYSFGIPRTINSDLHVFGIFRVNESTWISSIEKGDESTLSTDAEKTTKLQHFVFCFQTKTFECLAQDIEACIEKNRLSNVAPQLLSEMIIY